MVGALVWMVHILSLRHAELIADWVELDQREGLYSAQDDPQTEVNVLNMQFKFELQTVCVDEA